MQKELTPFIDLLKIQLLQKSHAMGAHHAHHHHHDGLGHQDEALWEHLVPQGAPSEWWGVPGVCPEGVEGLMGGLA